MILIIEGCDCVGKTTFANELAKRTGYEIVKGSSFEISQLGSEGMFDYSMELLDRDNIIVDRFFYSNIVYGTLFPYPKMSSKQYDELLVKMNKKALLVYLQTDPREIKIRMNQRGDDMIGVFDIEDILSEYSKAFYYYMPKAMISLDTKNSDFNIATAMVKAFINEDTTRTYIKATN